MAESCKSGRSQTEGVHLNWYQLTKAYVFLFEKLLAGEKHADWHYVLGFSHAHDDVHVFRSSCQGLLICYPAIQEKADFNVNNR